MNNVLTLCAKSVTVSMVTECKCHKIFGLTAIFQPIELNKSIELLNFLETVIYCSQFKDKFEVLFHFCHFCSSNGGSKK